jgi:hypothetical protein
LAIPPGLSEAWADAEAALPADWEVRGLLRGPRIAFPAISGPHWVAWARPKQGYNDEVLSPTEGRGDTPQEALNDLARRLREAGGPHQ